MHMLGDIEGGLKLIEQSVARAVESDHVPELMNAYLFKANREMSLGHAEAALRAAETLDDIHRNRQTENLGTMCAAWARARLGDREIGIAELKRAIAANMENNRLSIPGFRGRLAELEAEEGDFESALAQIDQALALAQEAEVHMSDVFLHRMRGEILLKRDPDNRAPAEDAFLTALSIAEQQSARLYGLRAALSLAKLYQSTARPVDAHAVLAPALEGFASTPEMPEIAEAQALLAELAEKQEVKTATASRKRRLQLEANYGVALTYSRGVAAEETKAAATRTERLAAEVCDSAARFAVYYAQWLASVISGQMGSARATAETYLREARKLGDLPDVASASRMLGHVRMLQGAFKEARTHLEEALRLYNPAWGIEVTRRQTTDWHITATALLGVVSWQLGEIKRAGELIEQAKKRASESQHRVTLANAYMFSTMLDVFRGEAEGALRNSKTLDEIATSIDVRIYSGLAEIYRGWARGRLGNVGVAFEEIHRGLDKLAEHKALVSVQLGQGLLAELEAQSPTLDRALTRIDEALALAKQTGQQWTDSLLNRIRGNILLKTVPDNPVPAEDAYRVAIAVAKEQGARSFGLQAAMSLAKLYQSTARPADAHAVLAPALNGFSPTPEMPEIAEGEGLLAEVAQYSEGE
jgi:predicted ATPase